MALFGALLDVLARKPRRCGSRPGPGPERQRPVEGASVGDKASMAASTAGDSTEPAPKRRNGR